jgi:carboxymethylenebutenolidase
MPMTLDTTARQQAIDLYDRFTHEGMERRAFMAEMVRLAGGIAAAELLIAGIAASPAAATIVAPDDKRLRTATVELALPGLPTYRAYTAEPSAAGAPRPSVLVIHENRGLNDHIRDVARRLALADVQAVAPDFLSPVGGTPANEDAARDAIGKLDLATSVGHAVRHLEALRTRKSGTGKVGAVGFCWGGGFVDSLAVAAGGKLAAGVSYYGPAPDPSEAAKVQAAMLLHLAGLDSRVAATARPFANALRAAGKIVEVYEYPGVNHAFNNDTSAERYDKAASDLAWGRTLDFFHRHLTSTIRTNST